MKKKINSRFVIIIYRKKHIIPTIFYVNKKKLIMQYLIEVRMCFEFKYRKKGGIKWVGIMFEKVK